MSTKTSALRGPRGRARPDFGRTVEDYVKHRPAVPTELFDRLARGFGIGLPGQRVLDVGTGTGAVARELARRGCVVTGLDPSPELLAAAAGLAASEGLNVQFIQGAAEATDLAEKTFDVAIAALCWHWFDGERAAIEIRRVLAPGGRLAIVHFEWLSKRGNIVEATKKLLGQHRNTLPGRRLVEKVGKAALARVLPGWNRGLGTGIRPEHMTTLAAAGYENLETFSFDVEVRFDHSAWRGRVRAHGSVGALQAPADVERLDTELTALLREEFPDEPLSVPHRVFVVVGSSP